MNWLPDILKRSSAESATAEYVECRHCGKSITDTEGECPACGNTEFSVYAAL